jgi:excisionase family DNA binding protein
MNAIKREFQREALSISEVCTAVGVGRTKIYEAIANRDLKARKIGNRTLILKDDLRQFLESLPLSN